jgi:predicted O-methyltransferase YrrM
MPLETERSYVTDSLQPPKWVTGHISHEDGQFLEELVRRGVRKPVLEIGVASGWSSAVLLNALNHSRPIYCGDHWLHSYDISERCYFDVSRRVGDAVSEVVPDLVRNWKLHTGNAVQAGRDFHGSRIDLAFIDADHRHPWTTFDLLGILPALAPDAWVALHDINLPNIAAKPEWRMFGPKHLFDLWPWEKHTSASEKRNIGAIRMPGDSRAVRSFIETVLSVPWETSVPRHLLIETTVTEKEGYRIEDGNSHEHTIAQLRMVTEKGRSIVLWGAGSTGRRFIQRFPEFRSAILSFIDISPRIQGTVVEGLSVEAPASLWTRQPRPFVCITSQFVDEIQESLKNQGFRHKEDFLRAPL